MADMRGKYPRKNVKTKKGKLMGRPKGAKTIYQYEDHEIEGLPKEAKYLSPKKVDILRGLLDPNIQNLPTDTEKCRAMNVSRSRFYNALKDPTFLKIYNEESMAIVRSETIPLLRSSIKFAKEKASNYRDRAMLFSMLGLVNNPDGIDVNINLQEKEKNIFQDLSLEELKALAEIHMRNNEFVDAEYKGVDNDGQA